MFNDLSRAAQSVLVEVKGVWFAVKQAICLDLSEVNMVVIFIYFQYFVWGTQFQLHFPTCPFVSNQCCKV